MITTFYTVLPKRVIFFVFPLFVLTGLTAPAFVPIISSPAHAAAFDALGDAQITSLQQHLTTMKDLAPKLRVQLRRMRAQVDFDVRQIHTIERSISQAERDLERLIAMHKRNGFNSIRAHFLADNLRRKAKGLHEGEAYVVGRIEGLREEPNGKAAALLEQYDQLRLLLGDYNQVVDQCLNIISVAGKAN